MFATNIDNADVVSVAGVTFSEGLHILSVHTLCAALGGILAAYCVEPGHALGVVAADAKRCTSERIRSGAASRFSREAR